MSGNCQVSYEGRASSTLGWGERLLIIKTDGSVLVHRPEGYEPVNWQPAGCVFQVEVEDEELRIRAARLQPREVLNIFFNRVLHLSTLTLTDEGDFSLYVSEQDMKRAILLAPKLVGEDFRPLTSEKELGAAGFVDVVGEDSEGRLVVVEIKRNPAGREAVRQLQRYIKAVGMRTERPLRGIIAAPSLTREAQALLSREGLEFKPVSLKRCYEVLKFEKTRKLSEFFPE
jgi:hypothetical protein